MSDFAKERRTLRRSEAAQYITQTYGIPCAVKTLECYAWNGKGPAFRLAGRFPLYNVADLDAWATAKMGPLVFSSSEAREAA